MQSLAGLSIEDWASIVAILAGLGGVIGFIVKITSIMNRLENSINVLNNTLQGLVGDNRDLKRRVGQVEDRLEEHIGEAKVRNQRITALEKEVFRHNEH